MKLAICFKLFEKICHFLGFSSLKGLGTSSRVWYITAKFRDVMECSSRLEFHEFKQFLKIFAIFRSIDFFPATEALEAPTRFDNKLLHSF